MVRISRAFRLFHVLTLSTFTALVLCICAPSVSIGQSAFSTRHNLVLDSALRTLGMNRSDCAMPPDLLTRDDHRTAFHDQLFSDPFFVFDYVGTLTKSISNRGSSPDPVFFEKLTNAMVLCTYKRQFYDGLLTADTVVKRLGLDPTTKAGFFGGTVLTQYLSALVAFDSAVADSRAKLFYLPIVMQMADSVWMQSKESESRSLWQMHQDEVQSQKTLEAFFGSANPLLYKDLYNNGISLYQQLLDYVNLSYKNVDLLRDSVKTTIFTTSRGRVAIGGKGDDIYEGDFLLILDLGGNDIYRLPDYTKAEAMARPSRAIIDLAGNDTYTAGKYSLGCGIAGASVLIDAQGDDLYTSSDFSQGCGVFGVGVIHDKAGNDSYISGSNTQGAGMFGIGLLIDDDGMDVYRAHSQAQGFGGTRGAGVLIDRKGNDQYLAASPYVDVLRYEDHQVTFTQGAALGSRPVASGGIGVLYDALGNDLYVCDIYGQGTGYWFGLGAVIDNSGEDRYQAYQYAQGAGVHFATGILRDMGGNDVYVSHGVSQGCGHDIALGMLLDDEGNDTYSVESLSLGGGNANAVSVLMDMLGDDAYTATHTETTLGFSDFRRTYGMIGLFIDAHGNDFYGERTRNKTTSVKSTYGVFLDADFVYEKPSTAKAGGELSNPLGPSSGSANHAGKLTNSPDSLFIQASAAPLRFQPNVKPARDKLATMGTAALKEISKHLGTQMPRERLTMEEVLPKLYEANKPETEKLLLDSLKSTSGAVTSLCATIVGKVKMKSAIPQLVQLSRNDSWKMRRLAALTMGEVNDSSAVPALGNLLKDSHPYVRARAAYAYGSMCQASELSNLRQSLKDPDAIVRYSAAEGVGRGRKRKLSDLMPLLPTAQKYNEAIAASRIFASLDTNASDVGDFNAYFPTASPRIKSTLKQIQFSMPEHIRNVLDDAPPAAPIVKNTTTALDTNPAPATDTLSPAELRKQKREKEKEEREEARRRKAEEREEAKRKKAEERKAKKEARAKEHDDADIKPEKIEKSDKAEKKA